MSIKLSIVVPVLNSHSVVRRQLLHFSRMELLPDTELILVDDGSDPPLYETVRPSGFSPSCSVVQTYSQAHKRHLTGSSGMSPDGKVSVTLLETNDKRPWTWALARNAGARIARGEYLLMFDLDHIVPAFAIRFIRETTALKVQFVREFGVLDENGVLTQDRDILEDYGLPREKGLRLGPLPNNFAMRRDLFWELGGYREDLVERPYPQGEDRAFRSVWRTYELAHGGEGSCVCPQRPRIFMFPNGKYLGDVDADPKGLFHGLSRKTRKNYWYSQQREQSVTS